MSYSFSELFCYFGGLFGIIMSLIIFVKMKGKAEVKISLILLIFVSSLIVVLGALMYSGKAASLPFLIRVDSPLHYLFPPLCFFYAYASFNPDFRFKWVHLLNLLPFLMNLVEFAPFYFGNLGEKIAYYQQFKTAGTVVMPMHYLFKTISLTSYFTLGLYVFFNYKFGRDRRGETRDSLISWFWIFFAGQAMLTLVMLADVLAGLKIFGDPYRFMIVMVSLFIYAITIALLLYPQILYGLNTGRGLKREKYSRSTLTGNEKGSILEKAQQFLASPEKPFLSPKLALPEVAGHIRVLPNQLSQVINEMTGLNFNDYINSFRVEEAKKLLSSGEFRKHTIDALAIKAGFNSKSPFYAAFKKHTGMTPKEFLTLQGSLK